MHRRTRRKEKGQKLCVVAEGKGHGERKGARAEGKGQGERKQGYQSIHRPGTNGITACPWSVYKTSG